MPFIFCIQPFSAEMPFCLCMQVAQGEAIVRLLAEAGADVDATLRALASGGPYCEPDVAFIKRTLVSAA